MPRKLILAAALAIAPGAFADAQVTDITTGRPDGDYYYFGLTPAYERPNTAADIRHNEIERQYREVVRTKIPDKKPSRDPWRTIRQAPAAPPYDRHRPE